MRLLNLASLRGTPAMASGICGMAIMVLVGGCSSRGGKTPQTATNYQAEVTADPQVRDALASACFDCHSNDGPTVWTARLAPSYVFGVEKARQALNFSDWSTYTSQRKHAELAVIGKVVADGSMPPADYDFVHPAARLSAAEKHILLLWISQQAAASP